MNKNKKLDIGENLTYTEIFFPEKYAKLFLLFYIVIIPIIVGHLFLFTYISELNFDIYSAVCRENNTFFIWCIGYEGFAILFFLVLIGLSVKRIGNF